MQEAQMSFVENNQHRKASFQGAFRCQPSCRHTGCTRTHEKSVKSWAYVGGRSAIF
jgi:hypothetical protein